MFDEEIKTVANSMALQNERLVRNAICHQIGYHWDQSDLIKRGSYRMFPNGSKFFSFDGVNLIQFFPIRSEVKTKDSIITLTITQPYKILYA